MKTALLMTLALTAVAVDAPAAELVPIEWTAAGRFNTELTVPASKFIEICGQLPAKAKVDWTFDAASPLNFNVHFHEGEKVHYPARLDGVAKASGSLDVQIDQDYCWMWTNKSTSEATLKLELKRS